LIVLVLVELPVWRALQPAVRQALQRAVQPAVRQALQRAVQRAVQPAVQPAVLRALQPAVRQAVRRALQQAVQQALQPAVRQALQQAVREGYLWFAVTVSPTILSSVIGQVVRLWIAAQARYVLRIVTVPVPRMFAVIRY
jgi:hypothetical protein